MTPEYDALQRKVIAEKMEKAYLNRLKSADKGIDPYLTVDEQIRDELRRKALIQQIAKEHEIK